MPNIVCYFIKHLMACTICIGIKFKQIFSNLFYVLISAHYIILVVPLHVSFFVEHFILILWWRKNSGKLLNTTPLHNSMSIFDVY